MSGLADEMLEAAAKVRLAQVNGWSNGGSEIVREEMWKGLSEIGREEYKKMVKPIVLAALQVGNENEKFI